MFNIFSWICFGVLFSFLFYYALDSVLEEKQMEKLQEASQMMP
ncbi:MAG: hypothetical protein ACTHJ2_09670 [Candidatus Nitrosocosmicus sp.]